MSKAIGRATGLTIFLGALLGCTTTYVGHKLPTSGQLPADEPSGIPFVMTRPEYSVDIAPDANDPTKPVYTLKSSDVPDPMQRYTIALDPALLVDGTFDLTFGEQGNITNASATSTSRVVATLEAMVSYAINKAAPGGAKDMGSVLAQYRFILKNSDDAACKKTRNGILIKDDIDRTIDKLIKDAQLEQRESEKKAADAKASSLAASRFHYRDVDQKTCLVAIAPAVAAGMNDPVTAAQNAYNAELSQSKNASKTKGPLAQQWVESLEAAVKAIDIETIEKLERANVPSDVKNVSGVAKAFANTKLDAKKLTLMGELFAFMSPDVWRSRHLQFLESQLKQQRLNRLVAPKGTKEAKQIDGEIARLEDDWAATLGEPKLVQRIGELDIFLAQIRVVPAGAGSPPRYAATEYVLLREERDKLQERVDRLRNELVAKNKVIDAEPEKKKVAPRTDVRVKLVKPSFIKTVADSPGTVGDLPEYVLVIEPIAEPLILPDPVKNGSK